MTAIIAACVALAVVGTAVFAAGAILGSGGDETASRYDSFSYGRAASRISVEIDNPVRGTTIEDADGILTVEGCVKDTAGRGVECAKVAISINGEERGSGFTDSGGRFSIGTYLDEPGENSIAVRVKSGAVEEEDYTICSWSPSSETGSETLFTELAADPESHMGWYVHFGGTLISVEEFEGVPSRNYLMVVEITGPDGIPVGMIVAGGTTAVQQVAGDEVEVRGDFDGTVEYQGSQALLLKNSACGPPDPQAVD